MKTWVLLILALFVAACQNDGGGDGGAAPANTTVTTPLTNCLDGTTYCNNQYYSAVPGFIPYPMPYGAYGQPYNYMAYFNRHGFCDCPYGTSPVYNPTYGLGCIRTRLLTQNYYGGGGAYLYWQFQMGTSWNTGWADASYYHYSAPTMPNNFAQYSNIPNGYYSGSGGSCPRNLTQSCLLNQPNTCGVGATCRQVLSGSALGVCANY